MGECVRSGMICCVNYMGLHRGCDKHRRKLLRGEDLISMVARIFRCQCMRKLPMASLTGSSIVFSTGTLVRRPQPRDP